MTFSCCHKYFRQRIRTFAFVMVGLISLAFTLGFWASFNLTRYQMRIIRETHERQLTQAVDQLGRMSKKEGKKKGKKK